MLVFFFIFSCILLPLRGWQDDFPTKFRFASYQQKFFVVDRIVLSMRSIYQDGVARVNEMNKERWMYEESPYYEAGYVMSEIMERYRRMVEHVRHANMAENTTETYYLNNVAELIFVIESVQRLYFEVYHLVGMMHEVFQKYRYDKEFAYIFDAVPQALWDEEKLSLQEQHLKEERKVMLAKQIKELKKEKQRLDKFRNLTKKGEISKSEAENIFNLNRLKKKYNRWWPLDYGFEIDYEW